MFGFLKKKQKEAFEQELLAQELESEVQEEESFDLDAIVAEFSDAPEAIVEQEPEKPEEETFTEEELIAEFSDHAVNQEPAEVADETPDEETAEMLEEDAAQVPAEEPVEEIAEVTAEEEEPAEEESAEEEEPTEEETLAEEESTEEEMPAEEESTEEEEPANKDVGGDTVRIDMPAADEVTADTIRIDFSETVNADTIRIDIPQEVSGDTMKFAPTNEALADTTPFTPVGTEVSQDKAEPFSEGWEPEYEQPMGEYVSPQPIQFQPKSRLRELKKKLVNGPERRYYELSELGFGRLQLAILVSLLLALLSAGTTVFYAMGLMTQRLKLVAFLQLFGMLIAALMGNQQIVDGITEIFHKRFSLNSLLAFSFIACIADGVFCLMEQRIPCCAAFTVQMTMSLWSTYQERSTEYGQMDTMRKATRLDSIVEVADYHEGNAGFLRGEGQVEDFMDHYQEPSVMDKIRSIYALAVTGVGLVLGVVAGMIHGSVSFGLQVLAAALLVAVPGTFFISFSRPMAILEKRLHKLGTVLCGWQRINRLCQKAAFPLRHGDLFPVGSCKLNGVKYYGSREPDQVVAYAAAVVASDGGGLTSLFEQLLQSRNGRHYSVRNLNRYGNGGIGGEVCGEPVLLGMHDFIKNMGVEIPEGTMVENAVYVAIDGELSAVFAVSCAKMRVASAGLATLCGYRGLRPVLVTSDFMLTEEFIHKKFGVNTRHMLFPEAKQRKALCEVIAQQDAPALAMTTRDGLASFAYAVSGARSVRTAAIMGLVIHMIGGILGVAAVAVLAVLAAKGLMTPVNMLLYQLVWMIPGLLVTEWTRSI